MKIQFRNSLVAVEQLNKRSSNNNSFLKTVEDSSSMGIVKFVGADASKDLEVGQKVVFGNKRETVVIDGLSLLVMDSENVLATITE